MAERHLASLRSLRTVSDNLDKTTHEQQTEEDEKIIDNNFAYNTSYKL